MCGSVRPRRIRHDEDAEDLLAARTPRRSHRLPSDSTALWPQSRGRHTHAGNHVGDSPLNDTIDSGHEAGFRTVCTMAARAWSKPVVEAIDLPAEKNDELEQRVTRLDRRRGRPATRAGIVVGEGDSNHRRAITVHRWMGAASTTARTTPLAPGPGAAAPARIRSTCCQLVRSPASESPVERLLRCEEARQGPDGRVSEPAVGVNPSTHESEQSTCPSVGAAGAATVHVLLGQDCAGCRYWLVSRRSPRLGCAAGCDRATAEASGSAPCEPIEDARGCNELHPCSRRWALSGPGCGTVSSKRSSACASDGAFTAPSRPPLGRAVPTKPTAAVKAIKSGRPKGGRSLGWGTRDLQTREGFSDLGAGSGFPEIQVLRSQDGVWVWRPKQLCPATVASG